MKAIQIEFMEKYAILSYRVLGYLQKQPGVKILGTSFERRVYEYVCCQVFWTQFTKPYQQKFRHSSLKEANTALFRNEKAEFIYVL